MGTMAIRPKAGLQLRKIKNQYMIVEACNDNLNMSNVYSLNNTAARLWEQIAGGSCTSQQLAGWLCSRYGIDMATALRDVEKQVADWEAYGLITLE